MKNRINQILKTLNENLYEREETIQLSLLTTLAGESIFLLGPPGVAKSLIARRLKTIFKDEKSFEYLMNRFSTPDEIFGPIAISKLKNEDKYERLTTKYLPWADVVFLDEIWKAGPSIQNSLLTVINEKVYRNGEQEVKIPLKGLIAASNELPAKGEGLEALWDRFIVRQLVSNISEASNFNDFIKSENIKTEVKIDDKLKISDTEFKEWQNEINTIKVSDEALNVINVIRHYINKYNSKAETELPIYVSDRRWRKIVRILKTSAFLNGRKAIDLMDCFLIAHTIWNEIEQIKVVNEFVVDAIKQHGYSLKSGLSELKKEIEDLLLDVANEVHVTKTIQYFVPDQITINGEYYYEIDDKTSWLENQFRRDYKYVKKDDFQSLDKEKYRNIGLFNKYGCKFSDYENVLQAAKLSENEIYIRKNHYNSDGISIPLKTYQKEKKEKVTQRPHKAVLAVWDRQVEELKILIDEEIQKINDYQDKELGDLKQNLFVPKDLAKYVEVNIRQTIEKLLEQKALLKKLKETYDAL